MTDKITDTTPPQRVEIELPKSADDVQLSPHMLAEIAYMAIGDFFTDYPPRERAKEFWNLFWNGEEQGLDSDDILEEISEEFGMQVWEPFENDDIDRIRELVEDAQYTARAHSRAAIFAYLNGGIHPHWKDIHPSNLVTYMP